MHNLTHLFRAAAGSLGICFSNSCCICNMDDESKTPELAFQIVKLSASSMWNTSVQAVLWCALRQFTPSLRGKST
jgi:hypothetical protein